MNTKICAGIASILFTLFACAQAPSPRLAAIELLRGPYLQAATSHSMVIRWRTSVLERGIVRFGKAPGALADSIVSEELKMDHIVKIEGLQPHTVYWYSIGGIGHMLQGDSDNYFKTLPQPGYDGLVRVAAFGDCGNNSPNQRAVRDQVLSYSGGRPDAWLLLGDNAYESGTDAEYGANFFDVFKDDILKNLPLFPAPGNHDYRDIGRYRGQSQKGQDVAYYMNFSMPVSGEAGGVPSRNPAFYSFDIGNVHFVSLDSYGQEAGGARLYDTTSQQVEWLKKDLLENQNKGWVVAYWHHPPYTMGSHNSDREQELVKIREHFLPLIERLGVDLVLCGHSHGYERTSMISGHYGMEATFDAKKYQHDSQTGEIKGGGSINTYVKKASAKGVVYVVAGSAGKIDSRVQSTYPHDAMAYSNVENGGAVIVEAVRDNLTVKWLCADGEIRDQFNIRKTTTKQ